MKHELQNFKFKVKIEKELTVQILFWRANSICRKRPFNKDDQLITDPTPSRI